MDDGLGGSVAAPVCGAKRRHLDLVVPRRCCVADLRELSHDHVYIGRGFDKLQLQRSPWANPFKLAQHTLDDSLALFQQSLCKSQSLLQMLPSLSGKVLACHCRESQKCHADVIIAEFKRRCLGQLPSLPSVYRPDSAPFAEVVLVVSVCDGIGALWLALKPVVFALRGVALEIDPFAISVTKHRFPHVRHLGDLRAFGAEELAKLVEQEKPRGIIVAGGTPCKQLSSANVGNKEGLQGKDSSLFFDFVRLVKAACALSALKGLWFAWLLEMVASLQQKQQDLMTSALLKADPRASLPVEWDAAHHAWVHRKRLWWMSGDPRPLLRGHFREALGRIVLLPSIAQEPLPSLANIFPGPWVPSCLSTSASEAFPQGRFSTFTCPVRPRTPFGWSSASEAEKQRFRLHREYGMSAYKDCNLAWRGDAWRVLLADEKEELMSFAKSHTNCGEVKLLPQQERERVRCTLLGNTWEVRSATLMMAILLSVVAQSLALSACVPAVVSLSSGVDQATFTYLQRVPAPVREVAGNFVHLFPQSLGDLNLFRRCASRLGLQYSPEVDLLEHDRRGLAAAAAGLQRGMHHSKHGLPAMLPEGLTPSEHWEQSHRHIKLFGHPFAQNAVLPVDTRVAASLPSLLHVRSARLAAEQTLASLSVALQPLSIALEDLMSARVRCVASGRNLGMWLVCMVLLEWPDVDLVSKMVTGFEIVGELGASGVFRKAVVGDESCSLSSLLADAESYVDTLLQTMGPAKQEDHDEQVWHLSEKDIAKGAAERWHSRDELDARFGRGRWRPFPRYAILQAHNGKWRAIDDGCRGLHNEATSAQERVHTASVEWIPSAAKSLVQASDVPLDIAGFVEDEEGAYRTVPTSDAHACVSIAAVWSPKHRCVKFLPLIGHAFGLMSAVLNYNRLPGFFVAVLTRIFAMVLTHFYDDYLVLDRSVSVASAKRAFLFAAGLLGFRFDAGKSQAPSQQFLYIGCSVDLSPLRALGHMVLDCKPGRREALVTEVQAIKQDGSLSSGRAGKLRCKAHFASTTLAGKALRGCELALIDRQYNRTLPVVVGPLALALDFLEEAARVLPARLISITSVRDVGIVYSDACFEPDAPAGLAFVLSSPRRLCPMASRVVLSVDDLSFMLQRKTQINQLEVFALLALFWSHPAAIRNMDLVCFVDNQGAVSALVKGYARNSDALDAACVVHLVAAQFNTRLWVEWVDSGANISDGLSRAQDGALPSWELMNSTLPPMSSVGAWKLQSLFAAFGSRM